MAQQALRELRMAAQMTYHEVAEKAGMSAPGCWQIENGKRSTSCSTMVKLAEAFNRIKKRREELRLSLFDMAQVIGVKGADQYLRREIGEYSFKVAEIPALSKTLQLPLKSFFIPKPRIKESHVKTGRCIADYPVGPS